MKKEMIKALSLGLSAVTLAGSMDITAFAEEDDGNVAENQQTTEGQQQETTSAEQEVVNDAKELNNDFQAEDGAVEIVKAVDECTSEDEAVQEAFDALLEEDITLHVDFDDEGNTVRDENGDIITHEDGEPTINSTYGINIENANDDMEDAASAIEDVQEDAEAISDKADEIDGYNNEIEGYTDDDGKYQKGIIDKAEDAAAEAEQAGSDAAASVANAVDSVKNDSVEVAKIKVNDADKAVNDAQKVFTEKKTELETLRAAYEAKLDERDIALGEYDDLIVDTLADDGSIAAAKEKLDDAEEELAEIEAALKLAEDEFARTAEKALIDAEDGYVENKDIEKYLQVVLANHVFEEEFTIDNFNTEDKTFEILIKDEDGNETSRVKYEYSVEDGVITVNEADKRFEWTITDSQTGEEVVVNKTESELIQMVANREAVKRYTIENEDGTVKYALESALTDEQKVTLPYTYVVFFSDVEKDENQSDSLDTTTNETVTLEGTVVKGFDTNGNYIETITNQTTKTVTKIVNGQVTSVTYTNENAASDNVVSAGLSDALDAEIAALKAELKKDGFKYTDANGNEITVAGRDVIDVGNASLIETPTVIWTASGWYVPVYIKDGNNIGEKEKVDTVYFESLLGNLISGTVDEREEAIAQKYQDQHSNVYVIGNARLYNPEDGILGILSASVDYVYRYNISIDDTFESRENAISGVNEYARTQNEGREYEEYTVIDEWVLIFPTKWHTEREYKDEVSGISEKYNGVVTGVSATQNASYDVTIQEHQSGTQRLLYTAIQTAAEEASKLVVFASDDESYQTKIADARAKAEAINILFENAKAARDEVIEAQERVDTIRGKIEKLNKADVDVDLVQIGEWDLALEKAEQQYADAAEKFEQTKKDLQDAKDALQKRIDEDAQNSNNGNDDNQTNDDTNQSDTTGENIVSGGGTGRRYYPTTAPIDTVFDPSVVFIDNPIVPLAGDTTTTTPRRNTNVINTADADIDTITVDDGNVPLAVDEDAVEETEEKVDEVSILPEETPLAGGTQENFFQQSWWWLLLLLIAAIAGGTAYAKKKAHDSENTTK